MQFFFIFSLLFFLSCQKEEPKTPVTPRPEKVISLEDEIGSFTFVSNVQGIDIKGDHISRDGDLTTGENLQLIEKSSSKVIDEFPMKDWGKVGFKVEEGIVHAYPVLGVFEIRYSVKEKKVIREPSCSFKNIPDDAKFDLLITESKKPNADWETIISGVSDLAKLGHKKSYEFFISPDAAAREILKKTEDGGVSISKVLRFMARNGCKW